VTGYYTDILTPAEMELFQSIAAILLVIVAAVVFILYPDAYSGTYEDVPVYASYFLPCFLILVFAVLILDIRINNFILRTAAQGLLILAVVTAMLYGTEILAGRHIYYITYNPLAFWLNIGYILSIATIVYALAGKIKPAMHKLKSRTILCIII